MILFAFFGAAQLAQPIVATVVPATPPAVASAVPAVPAATTLRLPALTPLRLRVEGEYSSKTHKAGDKVMIVLAEPLRVTETLAIPAGARGVGEVLHAAKGGMGGKPGELLLTARRLDLASGVSIPLRSFKLAPATGKNQQGVAMGLAIAGGAVGGVAAMIITGGSARVPDRSEAFAKTAADVDLPVTLLEPIASPEKTPVAMPVAVTSPLASPEPLAASVPAATPPAAPAN